MWRFHTRRSTATVVLLCLSGHAGAQPEPCSGMVPSSAAFLACVVTQIEQAEKTAPTADVIMQTSVAGNLTKLAEALPYDGDASNLEKLKSRSRALKADPVRHREPIAKLDSAIAAHRDEFRAIVTAALAATAIQGLESGRDFYPDFVRRKLAHFESGRPAAFYDRGPFEIVVRSLHATALEEDYFLSLARGDPTRASLVNAHQLIEDSLTRLRSNQHAYLPQSQRDTWANDYQFNAAALLYALGEKDAALAHLRKLAIDTSNFGLGRPRIDHVYLVNLYSMPSVMKKIADSDAGGRPIVKAEDAGTIRRFFNPAQLALFVCARLDQTGADSVTALARDVRDLPLIDYQVVVASGSKREALEALGRAIEAALATNEVAAPRTRAMARIAALETAGFPDAMRRGAKACNIDAETARRIYAPLSLRPVVEEIEGFGKYRFHLLLGGHLNASQARALSEFINQSVFPAVKAAREKAGPLNAAYIARMRIDG